MKTHCLTVTFQSNKAEAWSFKTFSQTTSCLCPSLTGLQVPRELVPRVFIFYYQFIFLSPLVILLSQILSLYSNYYCFTFRIEKGPKYNLGSLGRENLSFSHSCDFMQLLGRVSLTQWSGFRWQTEFDCPGLRQVEFGKYLARDR